MAKRRIEDNINFENARIIFRNFSGAPDKFNREGGVRGFSILIEDPGLAGRLADDGWNVRILRPREEGDEPRYHLPVAVSFKNIPPKVVMLTKRNRTRLDEESIECLDYAEIRGADITVKPYNWDVKGETGVKAYLKTMYVTIEEDEWEDKYAEMESPEE